MRYLVSLALIVAIALSYAFSIDSEGVAQTSTAEAATAPTPTPLVMTPSTSADAAALAPAALTPPDVNAPPAAMTAPVTESATTVEAVPAAAQPLPAPAPVKEVELPRPVLIKISHGITYMTGGVNDQEVKELAASENEFNVRIELNTKNGTPFKPVALSVLDFHDFELVAAKDAGPRFNAVVHPGTYFITINGRDKTKIKVPAKGVLKQTITVSE